MAHHQCTTGTVSILPIRGTTRLRYSLVSHYQCTMVQSCASPSEVPLDSGTISFLSIRGTSRLWYSLVSHLQCTMLQFHFSPSEAPLDSVSLVSHHQCTMVQFQPYPSEAPVDSGTVSCLTINAQCYSFNPIHQRHHWTLVQCRVSPSMYNGTLSFLSIRGTTTL